MGAGHRQAPAARARQDTSIGGAHGLTSTGQVSGTVFPVKQELWTMAASQELLEMLEDPTGGVSRDG
jgi:hypothetical protein